MNPYDFVRIDWQLPPERHVPAWHHRLTGADGQALYSGQLTLAIYVETPLYIADPHAGIHDLRKPAHSIRNAQGEYILPGSSLKGMLRSVVEALGSGCLTLFDGQYERRRVNYLPELPQEFRRCNDSTKLCLSCRIFGMLSQRGGGVFLGKINIGDARAVSDKVYLYDAIYTKPLMEPKPHHRSFYLDEQEKHIAGRKFYFHHSSESRPPEAQDIQRLRGGQPVNRYIQPLDYETQFQARIDFTNLEADELGALLLAVTLEENMRHKIGYGKPLGLGSIGLFPSSLTLTSFATRYLSKGTQRQNNQPLTGDAMWAAITEHTDAFYEKYLVAVAMDDLRRIWRWPADPDVDYYYPSKRDWFDSSDSHGKRIADTKYVP